VAPQPSPARRWQLECPRLGRDGVQVGGGFGGADFAHAPSIAGPSDTRLRADGHAAACGPQHRGSGQTPIAVMCSAVPSRWTSTAAMKWATELTSRSLPLTDCLISG